MKTGFARLDITPPFGYNLVGYFHARPADGIITPLYVNAVVIDDGEKKAAFVTLDAEGATVDCTRLMREYTSEKTGIDPDSITISCIHCHQGIGIYSMNNDFHHIVKTRVADAVKLAIDDLKESTAYIARGKAEGIAFVRLYRLKDGTTKTNPGLKSAPNIDGPIGTPDEEVQLIRFKRENAPDIAMVNFQMHPDVIGGTKICHDWPGFVRYYLEQTLSDEADGKGVHAICFNGAQGDTAHVDRTKLVDGIFVPRGGVNHSKHIAKVIVGAVLKIYTYAKEVNADKIFFKRHNVVVDCTTKPTPEQVEIARKAMSAYKEGTEQAKKEGRSEWEGGAGAIKAAGLDIDIVTARRYAGLASAPDTFDITLSCIGFGDVIFVGFPGEPFTEIGRQTKANSPFEMTFTACMTNGQQGYFPMKEVFTGGGYEATATRYAPGSAERIMEGAIALTKEMKEKYSTQAE